MSQGYRSAHPNQTAQLVQVNGREAYHSLWPLPPLSPVPIPGDPITTARQLKNESAYRQLLVEAVLTILLPTEDLENPCLTALVGQIFSELIIGNVIANKAVQPWLLFEAICIVGRVLEEKKLASNRSNAPSSGGKAQLKGSRRWSVQDFFVSIIQFALVFISTVRFAFSLITMPSSLPRRATRVDDFVLAPKHTAAGETASSQDSSSHARRAKVPVLSFNAWSCLGNVIELRSRMPWLGGFLSLLHLGATNGPGRIGKIDGVVDR